MIVSSDLTWTANTEYITKKSFGRLWILRRLKQIGAKENDLIDIYIKQVRTILEFATPVWSSSITKIESKQIERVQKCALSIILGLKYKSYKQALEYTNLENLNDRRDKIVFKFASKSVKHNKYKQWFQINNQVRNTRTETLKFLPVKANRGKLLNSPIAHMTKMLNFSNC